MRILTPLDPDWDILTDSLAIHLHSRDHPFEENVVIDECDASFSLTRNILTSHFPEDVDIEASIAYFRKNGWYCDCELYHEVPYGLSTSKYRQMEETNTLNPSKDVLYKLINEPETEEERDAFKRMIKEINLKNKNNQK